MLYSTSTQVTTWTTVNIDKPLSDYKWIYLQGSYEVGVESNIQAVNIAPIGIFKADKPKALLAMASVYSANIEFLLQVGCKYVSDTSLMVLAIVKNWNFTHFKIYGIK